MAAGEAPWWMYLLQNAGGGGGGGQDVWARLGQRNRMRAMGNPSSPEYAPGAAGAEFGPTQGDYGGQNTGNMTLNQPGLYQQSSQDFGPGYSSAGETGQPGEQIASGESEQVQGGEQTQRDVNQPQG